MFTRYKIWAAATAVALASSPFPALAEMTLLKREMFGPSGNLNAAQPGTNFDTVQGTFHHRPGGPKLDGGVAASADMRGEGSPVIGTFDLVPENSSKTFVGAWFLIKDALSTQSNILGFSDIFGNLGPTISIENGELGGGILFNSFSPAGLEPYHRWIYLGVAIHHKGGTTGDVRFYSKLQGQPMQTWLTLNDAYVGIGSVGSVFAGARAFGPILRGRLGAASVHSFTEDDFSDIAYPPDLVEPETGLTWYVNPLTGNDSNDGSAPDRAWKTVSKINTESFFTGIPTSVDHQSGDTLIIDTSGAPLELPAISLFLRTPGLNLRAAPGQEWIVFKGYHTLTAGGWMPTGTSNVYRTDDTELDIVIWEDDKWLHHPTGNAFADVATELSETPGSFWTDGNFLYLHPFDSTDPRVDGKRYERSQRFDGTTQIQLAAANMNIQDIHTGKTCIAQRATNTPFGANCVALAEPPGRSILKHCYLYYGDKHNLSLVQGAAGDDFLVDDVQCEQASPYAAAGGQTLYVSFNHKPESLGIIHRFHNCRATANAGLIGSTEGFMQSAYPVYLSHNLGQPGEPNQFELLEFVDCDFGNGNIQGEGVTNVHLKRVKCGGPGVRSDMVAEECTFTRLGAVIEGFSLVERNCVHVLQGEGDFGELRRNTVEGRIDIQGCTFDARAIMGVQGGVPQSALFNRDGPIEFTFRNNLVLMPSSFVNANVFAEFTHEDAIIMERNAYLLGGNRLMYGFDTGTGSQNQSFAQWQSMGYDVGSQNLGSLTLDGLQPVPGSPLIDAGFSLGPLADMTGAIFQQRDDIGAYEAPPTTYSAWQAEYFSPAQLADPLVSGPEATPAGDGVSNFVKFASGVGAWSTPPAIPSPESAPFQGSGQRIWPFVYYRNTWVTGLDYTFRYSSNLNGWDDSIVTEDLLLSTSNGIETRQASIQCEAGEQGFVQLQVSQ